MSFHPGLHSDWPLRPKSQKGVMTTGDLAVTTVEQKGKPKELPAPGKRRKGRKR